MSAALLDRPDRLRAVFARIDSGDQGADLAFGIVCKVFREAGLSWGELLDSYLERRGAPRPAHAKPFSDSPMPWSAEPAPQPPRWAHRTCSGRDIPAQLFGRIVEQERRRVGLRREVVVTVETLDCRYGPMVISDPVDIRRLDGSTRKIFRGRVCGSGEMPVLSDLRG